MVNRIQLFVKLASLDKSDHYTKLNSNICDKTNFLEIKFDSNKIQHQTAIKENSITYYVKQYLKYKNGKT